jgi:hypothetical protein
MNTQDGKPTIIVPDNQPVHMRRTPQLGDTIILHGGPRPAGPDAPSLDAGIAKGDSAGEPAAEDEALGGILGGHPPATTDSEKIFAASTPAADAAIGDAPTSLAEDELAWVAPEGEKCWVVHEPDTGIVVYTDFAVAKDWVDTSEGRASFCVPHAGENAPPPLEGFGAYLQNDGAAQAPDSGADVPRDTDEAAQTE